MTYPQFQEAAIRLVNEVASATAGSPNEASLRHEIEMALQRHAVALDIPWVPFRLDLTLRDDTTQATRFADVAHGAVVIEYEPPRAFHGAEGAVLRHACGQAEEYARLLQQEEGRALNDYILVAWDGAHIVFGRFIEDQPIWERLAPFTVNTAARLLQHLHDDGRPLVHPRLIAEIAGPESDLGAQLIPRLFSAILIAKGVEEASKTKLLFTEWSRLFGQVVGVQSVQLQSLLQRQSEAHQQPYTTYPTEYLFALNTYIALVAKLIAGMSLPMGSANLTVQTVPIRDRITALESGHLFIDAGIVNMLVGDFFSWYHDDAHWDEFAPTIAALVSRVSTINFDVTHRSPDSVRDLFKGLYESFVPRALRHALGEFYTPDWLAAHALDRVEWHPTTSILDPTCGSGTFLLEALRRRLATVAPEQRDAATLLQGLYGIDLNPLAILAARASLVVFLAPYLRPDAPVRLPIFLADAINTATVSHGLYQHALQTEMGTMRFTVPQEVVTHPDFFAVFGRIRELIDAECEADAIITALQGEFPSLIVSEDAWASLRSTVLTLVEMHRRGWNGIWCAILSDRFAAATIPPVELVIGNPPWVKWSHLPPEYAEFIKPRCMTLGVFSEDRWVGGIESDISTVVTYEAMKKWLAPNGHLAFFITGTVFSTESSQGFRRFRLSDGSVSCRVIRVEDFSPICPFDGVTNFPTLLIVQRDTATDYPVPYQIWRLSQGTPATVRAFRTVTDFYSHTTTEELWASPVPGTDAGPWLKGTLEEHEVWSRFFDTTVNAYQARKGVTADRNGIYFVRVLARSRDGALCTVENDPALGRDASIPTIRQQVETDHVFPLLRGRGVTAFSAQPDPTYRILVPQRGMHGDPDLPLTAPRTYRFFSRFRTILEARSSYRRFQRGKPFWSLWSTGAYTFSPYKVLWREMSGGKFAVAYIGGYDDPLLGERLVIPDHKLYFIAVDTEQEAAYLTALLNAPTLARAVSAYATQLSLGVSVCEYLHIPVYHAENAYHSRLADIGMTITRRGGNPSADELAIIDQDVHQMLAR